MNVKGIDVSSHNGLIDWNRVCHSGIKFAIIRIGFGMYGNQKDSMFEKNYENARKYGIKVGVYHYSYAVSVDEALKEADVCLSWLSGRNLDLPVFFDIEDRSQQSLGKNVLNAMCKSFCNKIESGGYWAGIYSNKYWATSILDGNSLGKRYVYWIAQYNDRCTYDGDYVMWQYSSSGRIDGINSLVDMDILYKNIGGTTSHFVKQKSNDLIALEVIEGKWGNGNDRKSKLISAGYDYDIIQNIVNKKVGNYKIYKVVSGDTLSSIAKRFGTTYQNIAKDNDICDVNKIYPGQCLKIYKH